MTWKGLGVWARDRSMLEWPPDLWKLAMCFAGRLRKAVWELAFSRWPGMQAAQLTF